MKKFIIILSAIFLVTYAIAQPCLPEGIVFYSQAQINNFQTNYPNCTEIEGDVTISGDDIVYLNGLNVLTSIGGDLMIEGVGNIASLEGLNNLISIAGDLKIFATALTSLTGLENLTSVGGIYISDNYSLSTCESEWLCNYLSNPSGVVEICRNAYGCKSVVEAANACGGSIPCLPFGNYYFVSKADIDNFQSAFPNCTELEGNVTICGSNIINLDGLSPVTMIGGDLSILSNTSMTSLSGLESLTAVGGNLTIDFNHHLTGVPELAGLNSVGGNLTIRENSALTSLTGLLSLTSIAGDLSITNNQNLASLAGLENIEAGSVNNLIILQNISLANCEAESICDYLASPNGTVEIFNNDAGCNSPAEIADACGISLPCLPYGNYWFYSQAEIDSFQVNYPGCVDLDGNVIIVGYLNQITNLNGLSGLASVSGNLEIYDCNLASLTGLDNLTAIGGRFVIANIIGLAGITGLDNLDSVGGTLAISGNALLDDLSGLEGLTSIGGLNIGYNNILTSLVGLENITSIGGEVEISMNESLISLNGLNNVASIAGNFLIRQNAALTSFSGLGNLASIGGYFLIENNGALVNFSGLESLTSIGDYLSLYDNNALVDFTGLGNLASIGGDLGIYFSDSLTSLAGLEGLNSIGGDLTIYSNSLTSLTGLDNIDPGSINNLTIVDNFALSTCEAQWLCDYLSDPGGVVKIYRNAFGCYSIIELANACGDPMPCLPYGNYLFTSQADIDNFQSAFPNCTELEGNVFIGGFDITNFTGIGNVVSIGGDLEMCYLINLMGMEGLNSIGGNLDIYDSYELTSLTGLEGLNSIGGDLQIHYNYSLTSLTGLDNIDAGSIVGLYIYNNDMLSECEIQSICDYLISPNGIIDINTNAIGCNSQEEVEANCGVGLNDNAVQENQVSIYPNPISGQFTMTFTLEKSAGVNLSIVNRLGQVVAVILDEKMQPGAHEVTWNAETLPSGIYLYRFLAGSQSSSGKMVVVK